MQTLSFGRLMTRILTEYRNEGSALGISRYHRAMGVARPIFGGWIETPFGPASGAHTRYSQNLVAAYLTGARFFELDTVRCDDGEAAVGAALAENVRAWFAMKLLAREMGVGSPEGFVFNMSLDGEATGSERIDRYIDGMKNAAETEVWNECIDWTLENLPMFMRVKEEHVRSISPAVSRSATLAVDGDLRKKELAAEHLLREKGLHTWIKLGPEMLGAEAVRAKLQKLGYAEAMPDEERFEAAPSLDEVAPMLERLNAYAAEQGLEFGAKIAGALPRRNGEGAVSYMTGLPLLPIAVSLARQIAEATKGRIRISYSGGADAHSIRTLVGAGVWPVTMSDAISRPGGYERTTQFSEELGFFAPMGFGGVDIMALRNLEEESLEDEYYKKHGELPHGLKKLGKLPVFGCAAAPCRSACPLGQDIPAFLRLIRDERFGEALRVIVEKNPLPNITGALCHGECMPVCMRAAYEAPVDIRAMLREAAFQGHRQARQMLSAGQPVERRAAVIGAGPAGLAAAAFLAHAGIDTTIFEKQAEAGGMARSAVAEAGGEEFAVERDLQLVTAMGAKLETGVEIKSEGELRKRGFADIIVASGEGSALVDEPDVFVIGGARREMRSVVEAVADAQRAARELAGISLDTFSRLNRGDRLTGLARHGQIDLYGELDEAEKCLECESVCEVCVEICPNRANVAVPSTPYGSREVVHIDALCNECGLCAAHCPWGGEPFHGKFTVFSDEESFAASSNEGVLIRDGAVLRKRVSEPSAIADGLIEALCGDYKYLL